MNPVNPQRMEGIIQYLQSNDLFDLDIMDLYEMSEEEVIKHFDLSGLALTEIERWELMVEVTKRAGEVQTAEIVRSILEA